MKKSILILAIGFLPNIGGLETHLKDLIAELIKRDWRVTVLTYQPLHTPVLGKWIEKEHNLTIYRLPAFRGLFYKLLKIPILEFIFLEPLLFLATPLVILLNPGINIINGQGLIAGFSASFWSKVFTKKYVVAAQSVYNFPKNGLYHNVCQWIFKSANKVVAISTQSAATIEKLGVNLENIQIYTNWEDVNLFTPVEKQQAKEEVGFPNKFIVSFFGRLVEEKGLKLLLESIKLCDKKITFAIYGEGPLLDLVLNAKQQSENIIYMKTITPDKLPLHYSAADLIVMPSLHEEGFGRVAAGALLCGVPVIASNRGALPNVVASNVGKIIEPTPLNIAQAINTLFLNRKVLKKYAANARKYALNKFSSKNAESIISAFS